MPVQTGIATQTRVEIVSGLTPGQQAVVVGQNRLRDGVPIQIAGPTGGGAGGTSNRGPSRATPSPGQAN